MAATLLLVGRDGNGKSSTGNSILGRRAFNPRSTNQASAGEVTTGSSVIDGKEIRVIDGPGIGDTDQTDRVSVKLTLQNVDTAIELCPDGFTALIIVFKYGDRFTQQEKDTVMLVRSIFGERIFKDYGIIVMTHGDNFVLDQEDDKTPFEEWLSAQTGGISSLLKECGNRCVLFNNRAKDDWSVREQRDLLFTNFASIQNGIAPYTLDEYRKAANGRKVVTVACKKPILEKETKQVLEEISRRLTRVDVYGSPETAIQQISELQEMIDRHKRKLKAESENTDLMKDLLVQVSVTESGLETKAKLAELTLGQRQQTPSRTVDESAYIMHERHGNRQEDGVCHELYKGLRQMASCCFYCLGYLVQSCVRFCRSQ